METVNSGRPRIGYWLSEKKSKKFNLEEFHEICDREGLELVKVSTGIPQASILKATFNCV